MGRSKKAKEAAKKALRTTSLGSWFFDKHGKKKYISLNGKVAHGAEATRLSQKDMYHEQHPAQLMRMELCQRMKTEASSTSLMQIYRQTRVNGIDVLDEDNRLLLLNCWGLPSAVLARYHTLGITKLFQWQVDCLLIEDGQVLDGSKNMIYSAPTSGGKTLVAELLMIRKLAQTMVHGNPKRHPRRTIFFIVPFIALAEEKVNYLQHLWQDMNIGVRAFHQDDGSSSDLGTDVEVVVCTIERANILLTKLLQEKRGSQLSMVVIDEIHMLSDPNRGFLLEVLLSKIRFSLHKTVQIIGMSATLPNIELLADWLDATLYRTDYRPISLQLLVAREGGLFSIHHDPHLKETVHTKESDLMMSKEDPDGLVALCLDSMRNRRNMIIFCQSKIRCEQTTLQLAYLLQYQALTQEEYGSVEVHLKRAQLLRRLDTGLTAHGLCPKLQQTIPFGIAYHHAGLVKEERKLLEEAYREGIITVLAATSTLAAGVNLPAHRVIILSLSMGDAKLSVSTFRQMCGRAGRLGFQTSPPSVATGEAIVMMGMKPSLEKLRHLEELLTHPVEALQSNLDRAAGGGLEKLLLEMIACECISRSDQTLAFLRSTLYGSHHSLQESMAKVQAALVYLQQQQFVLVMEDGTMHATAFGRATIASGIAPNDAVEVLRILNAARRSFVMTSGLHALFLVVPPDTMIRTDWKGFDKLLDTLYQEHPEAESVAQEIGIEKARLVDFSLGRKMVKSGPEYQLYNRFFSAVVLFPLMHEWPLPKTMKKIVTAVDNGYPGVSRGDFQVLLRDTTVFCGQVVVFCQHLNWPLLTAMEDYSRRLSCSQRPELKELIQVGTEVTAVRAKLFHDRGWKNAEDLINAGAEQISACILDCLPYQHDEQLSLQSASASGGGQANMSVSQVHVNKRVRLQQNTREMADKIVQRAMKIVRAHQQDLFEKQHAEAAIVQQQPIEETKSGEVEKMVVIGAVDEVEPDDDELAAWAELNVA